MGLLHRYCVRISAAAIINIIIATASFGVLPEVEFTNNPITPIPTDTSFDIDKAKLGKRIFNDPILSANNKLSCSSCHKLDNGGADNRAFSFGYDNKPLSANTLTVLNSVYNKWLYWDGRIKSLDDLIGDKILNPSLLNTTWNDVISKLKQSKRYSSIFYGIYSEEISARMVKDALIHYLRSLTTPNSRFDKYLRGDNNAISDEEKEGYYEFKSHGCISCHQGVNLGGNVFQKFKIFGDERRKGSLTEYDQGRFNITRRERDRYVFRVPNLRNVELTAPYFHDGSAATLEEAVKMMAQFQLGVTPSEKDINLMVKFLRTLTSEVKELR